MVCRKDEGATGERYIGNQALPMAKNEADISVILRENILNNLNLKMLSS
jgi:hypothetical protein